jgi:putative tryptophan/tyrosine transport system substrate-binding protein
VRQLQIAYCRLPIGVAAVFVFAFSLSVAAAPLVADAQQRAQAARIGWVAIGPQSGRTSTFLEAFRQGMRDLGYVEGQNLAIEARWADGGLDRVADLTRELVRSKVDVIVTQGPVVSMVKKAAGKIPIVFGFSGDPVEAGLVTSLSHPGDNITGMTFLSLELAGKRLELLKELSPGLSQIAILANPQHPGEQREWQASQAAARSLGVKLQYFPVRTSKNFEDAFERIVAERSEAIDAFPDALVMTQRIPIASFSARQRIPAISGWRDFAADGNLLTYGPSLWDSFRRLGTYADKILRGLKPADLPVEQPTKLELVVNLKTAKALGVTIPQSILVRADEVIR